jgi:hypothetical protein
VLARGGSEAALKGENGFVCTVDRGWQARFSDPEFWNPKVRSPVCLNSQAVRSVLPIQLKRTELVLAGLSKTEIRARIKTAISRKEFAPPEIGSMTYGTGRDLRLELRDAVADYWHLLANGTSSSRHHRQNIRRFDRLA